MGQNQAKAPSTVPEPPLHPPESTKLSSANLSRPGTESEQDGEFEAPPELIPLAADESQIQRIHSLESERDVLDTEVSNIEQRLFSLKSVVEDEVNRVLQSHQEEADEARRRQETAHSSDLEGLRRRHHSKVETFLLESTRQVLPALEASLKEKMRAEFESRLDVEWARRKEELTVAHNLDFSRIVSVIDEENSNSVSKFREEQRQMSKKRSRTSFSLTETIGSFFSPRTKARLDEEARVAQETGDEQKGEVDDDDGDDDDSDNSDSSGN